MCMQKIRSNGKMKNYTRSKNIFVNTLLIFALILSMIGGAILMSPYKSRFAGADTTLTGKPDDVKLVSKIVSSTATKYDADNGFTYTTSQFNYVNLRNVIYYVEGSTLYTDPDRQNVAQDVTEVSRNGRDVKFKFITSKDADTGAITATSGEVNYTVYTSVYTIRHNGTLYYFDGTSKKLYTDIARTNELSLTYDVYNSAENIAIYDDDSLDITNELPNRYVTINGTKYYLDEDNNLYDNTVTTVFTTVTTGVATTDKVDDNEYTYNGNFFPKSNSIDVLYNFDTTTNYKETNGEITTNYYGFIYNAQQYYFKQSDVTDASAGNSISAYTATADSSNNLTNVTSANTSFTIAVIKKEGSTDTKAILCNIAYNTLSGSYKTQFEFGGTNYYVIGGAVCTKTADSSHKLNHTASFSTYKHYTFENSTKTFTIDKNTARTINELYPIEILGRVYYFKTSHLYLDAGGTQELDYINSRSDVNFSEYEITTSNNIVTITVTYTATYSNKDGFVREVYPTTIASKLSNFISCDHTYYYNNNALYLDASHTIEAQDLSYTCDITGVTVDRNTYELSTTNLKYVVVDGYTYYVDDYDKNNVNLYYTVRVGSTPTNLSDYTTHDNLTYFLNSSKVVNGTFAYKVNTSKNLITFFTDEAEELESSLVSTYPFKINDDTYTYYVTTDGSTDYSLVYLFTTTQSITGGTETVVKEIPYHDINFDYEGKDLAIDSNGYYTTNSKIIINGNTYNLEHSAYYTSDNGKDYYYHYLTEGGSRYSIEGQYLMYHKNTGLFITGNNSGDPTLSAKITIKVGTTSYSDDGKSFTTSKGYRDYLIVNNKIFFGDSKKYTGTTTTYTDNDGNDHTFTISGNQLTINEMDICNKFFSYKYNADTSSVELISKYVYDATSITKDSDGKVTTITTGKIESKDDIACAIEDIEYVETIDDKKYVKMRSGNSFKLYDYISYDINHTITPSSTTPTSYSFNAVKLVLDYLPSAQYFDILSNSGQEYDSSVSDTFNNDSIVMLDNYQHKISLSSGSGTGAEVNQLYIGFNAKRNFGDTPTITSGVYKLEVQAFLNNDYVTKYKTISSAYFTKDGVSYGIKLQINNVQEEDVRYSGQTEDNYNYYWYQHIDLTKVYAIINYNNGVSATEHIEDASGLYTFIFNYTYINGNTSQQYTYTYRLYITESSDYVEYPTFNTRLNTTTDPTKKSYKDVVAAELNATNRSTGNYSFNNETQDLPIYTYNASKYNVKYSQEYNIQQNDYTTSFSILRSGTSTEAGELTVYKDGLIQDTYTLKITKFSSGSFAVMYIKNGVHYGDLYVSADGEYLLSLNNFYYYNPTNYSDSWNNSEYETFLKNGRLIRNGAKNTPASYYMCLVFDELGKYTIENKYLLPKGESSPTGSNSEFIILPDKTNNTFYGCTYSTSYRDSEVIQAGEYRNGELYVSGITSNSTSGDIVATTPDEFVLTYYGIVSTFIKDSNEIKFRKLDDNVYSDITSGDVRFLTFIEGKLVGGTNYSNLIINFNDSENITGTDVDTTTAYTALQIPLTNLQPIHFKYYGDFDYSKSKYYRFSNFDYTLDNNSMVKSINLDKATKTTLNFTNKTDISAPGFYIVKVVYTNPTWGASVVKTTYFAFIIDNSGPDLKIFTGENTEPFISSTTFEKTTRYTNTATLKATWAKPNYFQGNVSLDYSISSYDGTQIYSNVNNYTNGSTINTREGKYTFKIKYGIGGESFTYTYLIVDKTTPSGQLYSVDSDNSLTYSEYISAINIFSTESVFASKLEKDSGAKIYARILTVSFDNYDNGGITDGLPNKVILNSGKNGIDAIKTTIQLDGGNISFNSDISSSPKYSFLNIDDITSIQNGGATVTPQQILGTSDQSLLYIIKLYDQAGNEQYYYYIYDNSQASIVYEVLNAGDEFKDRIQSALANNTAQTNTAVHWGSYKAIKINDYNNSNALFTTFKELINSNPTVYSGMKFVNVGSEYYLYVPIKKVEIDSTVDVKQVNESVTATTTSDIASNFASNFTAFTSKTNNVEELHNKIKTSNPTNKFVLTYTGTSERLDDNYYANFFKSDKNYTIYVTDLAGNRSSGLLTMNSSVAGETFFLNEKSDLDDGSNNLSNPTKKRAFNAEQLGVHYIDLTKDEQPFYAQITYDFYSINLSKYLTSSGGESSDIMYSTTAYDTETGDTYEYINDKFYKDGKTKNADDTDIPGIEFSNLSDTTFIAGYPYSKTSERNSIVVEDKIVTTIIDSTSSTSYYKNINAINGASGTTQEGLYVFRRSYLSPDGKELTQEDIDNDETYSKLEDDYAIRYYAYYIDRNDVISLTYDSNGKLDPINSIGDLISIYLGEIIDETNTGSQIKYVKDELITADIIKSGTSDITTNKLKIETNIATEKYATAEKLQKYRSYSIDSDESYNKFMENLSQRTNANTFKYNVSLSLTLGGSGSTQNVITNNKIDSNNAYLIQQVDSVVDLTSVTGGVKKVNYSSNSTATYSITIADSSNFSPSENPNNHRIDAKSESISFAVNHSSPDGVFTTIEADTTQSIRQLDIRSIGATTINGTTKTFVSSNVTNLSFQFSDSSDKYSASINPFQVVVSKRTSSGTATLLKTNYSANGEAGNYKDRFKNVEVAVGITAGNVFEVIGDEAPYTYRINIFNKDSEKRLLSNWEDDATYIVKINYIGTESDYINNGSNYYTTTCEIHIDRQAPSLNLEKISNADKNLNYYTRSMYGKNYTQLAQSSNSTDKANYFELLTTYAFPVMRIDDANLFYYYKKTHPDTIYTSIPEESKVEVYENYGTTFTHSYDDSVALYVRGIGDDVASYKYAILPTEDAYSEGINGHIKFTEASTEFKKLTYPENSNLYPSTITNDANVRIFSTTGYYEIIEVDEAGNYSRYLTYVSDNTDVELKTDFINRQDDEITQYVDESGTAIDKLNDYIVYYIDYVNAEGSSQRYYLSNHNGSEWKVYEKQTIEDSSTKIKKIKLKEKTSTEPTITINSLTYYVGNTTVSIPTEAIVDGTPYVVNKDTTASDNLIGGTKLISQDYSSTSPLSVLNLTELHFVKPNTSTSTSTPADPSTTSSTTDKYIFDDFFTINCYLAGSNVPILTKINTPFNGLSIEEFLQETIDEFNQYVADDSSNFSYRIEIVNRFYSDNNYIIYVNFPDAELSLDFKTNADGNLEVSIPEPSTYNVKIKQFSVFYYEDYQWKPLSEDSNKKGIQTSSEDGLTATTYVFGNGQYKFFYKDNFDRTTTEYYIVGSDSNREIDFNFSKPHIADGNNYITSGTSSLLIDDSIWQIQAVLKNAVVIPKETTGDEYDIKVGTKKYQCTYYDIVTVGNSSYLCRLNGTDINYIYYDGNGGTPTLTTSGISRVYYYMGALYIDEACKNRLEDNGIDYKIRLKTSGRSIYTLGNDVDHRKCLIFSYFDKSDFFTSNELEYKLIINWITAPTDKTEYTITIDRTSPTVTLMTESGALTPINNQSYNKSFTIYWKSNYKITSVKLVISSDITRTEVSLDPNGSYDVHIYGTYVLYITDEIGNELSIDGKTVGFEFSFVKTANEYFSIYVNNIYILPSDYITTFDGKTVQYYYYKASSSGSDDIVIKTDETKNIAYSVEDAISEGDISGYRIYRSNINYTICYVKLIPVAETESLKSFVTSLTKKPVDGAEETLTSDKNQIPNSTIELDQTYESFTLKVYKYLDPVRNTLNPNYYGNLIKVYQYYNGQLIKIHTADSWTTSNKDNTFSITISSTGVHKFEFYDSVNNKCSRSINVTLIKDIMFTVNEENPIDNRIYNGKVTINIPEVDYYSNVDVKATLNGVEIDTNSHKIGTTKYAFSDSGLYVIGLTASKGTITYNSTYSFTIINANVAKMTFGFSSIYGFTINKVIKNNADITSSITSSSLDSMWLTSGQPNTVGTYNISLIGYDKLTNDYKEFSFVVKLNNEVPSIFPIDYEYGTKTRKAITLQYNPALIYSQVGESYILITGDNGASEQIDIDSNSPDMLANIVITNNGKYNITIYNKDGNFITNYTATKIAPLNTSAKIIIIIACVIVAALTVAFIILRRHTKFR